MFCFPANLIQLGDAEKEGLVENTNSFMVCSVVHIRCSFWPDLPLVCLLTVQFVVTRLLECCKIYVQNKKSSLSHWHPVLGWFQQKTDQGYVYSALSPLSEASLAAFIMYESAPVDFPFMLNHLL